MEFYSIIQYYAKFVAITELRTVSTYYWICFTEFFMILDIQYSYVFQTSQKFDV